MQYRQYKQNRQYKMLQLKTLLGLLRDAIKIGNATLATELLDEIELRLS